MTSRSLLGAGLLALALHFTPLAASPAHAEGTATGTAAAVQKKAVPAGFERVSGLAPEDRLDPNPLVVGAYAMFFVVMFGYLIHIARSQSSMAKEMGELAERIRRAEKK